MPPPFFKQFLKADMITCWYLICAFVYHIFFTVIFFTRHNRHKRCRCNLIHHNTSFFLPVFNRSNNVRCFYLEFKFLLCFFPPPFELCAPPHTQCHGLSCFHLHPLCLPVPRHSSLGAGEGACPRASDSPGLGSPSSGRRWSRGSMTPSLPSPLPTRRPTRRRDSPTHHYPPPYENEFKEGSELNFFLRSILWSQIEP